MNDSTSFFHTASLSVWTWSCDCCAYPGCEQDPAAGRITPVDSFTAQGKPLFPASRSEVKNSVCCLDEGSSSIDTLVSNISEQKLCFLFLQAAIDHDSLSLSLQAQPSIRKTIFLSLWIQLELSINLTEEVSCTELTNSGMLLRISCYIRLLSFLNFNLDVIWLGINSLMEIYRTHGLFKHL